MFTELKMSHDHVAGIKAGKNISKEEMEKSFEVILNKMESRSKVNLYMEVEGWEGLDMDAFIEDIRLSFGNLGKFLKNVEKIALVTDSKFIQESASIGYKLIPSIELKTFSLEEKDTANTWLI
jgi:hypothetical protein